MHYLCFCTTTRVLATCGKLVRNSFNGSFYVPYSDYVQSLIVDLSRITVVVDRYDHP